MLVLDRTELKSADANYIVFYTVEYIPSQRDWHGGDADIWVFYRQKIWPCVEAELLSRSYHRDQAVLVIRQYCDLSDPYTRSTYDAIKQGITSASTTALSAELLPTCDDYVPSKT